MNFTPLRLAAIAAFLSTATAAEPIKHGTGDAPAAATPEAANAMKSFKYDGGLKVDLFAAEPLLANPVCFSIDEKGRWYVSESYRQEKGIEDNRGHMDWLATDIASRTTDDRLALMHKFYPDPKKFAEKFTQFEERIVRLEDTNGDGVADKQTIYADGFRDPLDGTGAGILARGNDVWWTCIPNLWHFRDADGDGKAELKEKLLSGFGVKFAFRGHDMHGLRFGPDGRLYFSIGDRAIHVQTKEGTTVAEPDTGSIMRCNADGTNFEVFATGVRNPQELAFDELGNLFTGDNNSDAGDKARFLQLVEGGDYGWRMAFQYLPDRGPWNREMLWDEVKGPAAKYIVPPVANIGNGPSGLTFNPGTGLGERHHGRFFLSDFRGGASASVVHQIALEPKGAFFKVKELHDFVKGVLTTDVEFGNDGSLYVLDWVESWGGVGKGRMYKFTDPSANTALQAETQKLIGEGMSQRGDGELAGLLGHADQRVRQAAQFALAVKGDAAAPVFMRVAGDVKAPPLARIHAIWGLGQVAEKKADALQPLLALLADGDAEVRAQAAHVLSDRKFATTADKLVAMLKDASARPRFFAAIGLGRLAFKPAVEPLFQMLAENNDADPVLRHGAVMGLKSCASAEQLVAKAHDGSVAVRVGALVALRRQQSPEVAVFLKDADESVVLEAARAIHDVPIEAAMPALAALTTEKRIKNPRILERVVNANYRIGKADKARALAAYAADGSAPEVARKDALDALAEWGGPNPQDRVLNMWRPIPNRPPTDAVAAVTPILPALLKDAPGGIMEMAAKLAGKLAIGAAGEPLAALVSNDKAPAPARIAALQALATLKDKRLEAAAKSAFAAKDAKLRSEALQALAAQEPGAAVQMIGEAIQRGSVVEKQGALAALSLIQRPESAALLSSLMDQLISKQGPAEIRLDIYEAAKKSGAQEVKDKIAQYKASLPANDPLAPYKISRAGGDAARGLKIFREKQEVQCFRCHKCDGGDSVVGPDLTHIGASKDRNYILESIVFPNKVIAPGFAIVSLTLKDGSAVVGRVLSENGSDIKVETLDAAGKPQQVTVPTANIKERLSAPSPMPENTRDNLTRSELRDVIEYLATRK